LSRSTLHRWAAEGLVAEGREYRNGLTLRSPRRWNIQRLEERIKLLRTLPAAPSGGWSEQRTSVQTAGVQESRP
ncbi:MAG: hypothetical protein VKI42_06425, partial [Synechococcaceae cyanobacterium]|nr:hypothetical protein [Synechococcaceae cyanobacterium]